MTEINFLLEALDKRWEQYRVDLKACRLEFSEEGIHDLRVNTRRMLAVTDIIRAINPHPRMKIIRRELKAQLDGLDELRDVQVMLADISENIAFVPQLAPFQKYLQKKEIRELRVARKLILAIKLRALKQQLQQMRSEFDPGPPEELGGRLYRVVDDVYEVIRQRYGWLDPDQPASIHSLRIAFKRFRYTIECLHTILPGFPQAIFKSMHEYQTMMGNIQDAEVAQSKFAQYMRRHRDQDHAPVIEMYQRNFNEALAVFLDARAQCQLFWRQSPEMNFPWETEKSNE